MQDGNVIPISKPAEFPFTPTDDVVVIDRVIEEKTTGGLILPGSEKNLPCGYVVAVGPGRVYDIFMDASGQTQAGKQMPMSLKVGDFVVMGKWQSGGEPVEYNGKKYLLCSERDVALKSTDGLPRRIKLAIKDE